MADNDRDIRIGEVMWEYIIKGLLGLLLIIVSIQDIKWKKIRLWIVLIATIILSVCALFSSSLSILDRVFGLLLGLAMVLLSKATGGKIGIGDGMVLGVTGIGLGFWSNMELFALALSMAAVFSIGLIILRRANRSTAIPFMPFLFLSYIILNIPV